MATATYKVIVSGMVQGVGFRASMKDTALRHDVAGWVRNRDDGTVEALLQGEEAQVMKVLEWARQGPAGAAVTSLKTQRLTESLPQVGFHVFVSQRR